MKKVILLNGIITVAGFLLDIYGVFDLSLSPAIIGLTLGIVDCITFLWMREEIKATIRRWKAGREIVLPYWFEDMKRRRVYDSGYNNWSQSTQSSVIFG